MEKQKKTIIALVVLVVLAVSAFAAYKMTTKEGEKEEQKQNETNKNEKISKESIEELSKKLTKNLNTKFETKIEIDYFEKSKNIELRNEDGKLYIAVSSYKSAVTDIDDKVVQIVDAKNSCSLTAQDILILTEKGDLYRLESGDTETRLSKDVKDNLKKNKEVTLKLEKLNSGDEKVLGISNYYHYKECYTCGSGPVAVYTSKEQYKEYDTFKEVKIDEKVKCPEE